MTVQLDHSRRKRRWRWSLPACACALSLNGSVLAEPPVRAHTVIIEGVQFNPATLTVHRGDQIVWRNKDLFPHTVTAKLKTFNSGDIPSGAFWAYIPLSAGDFDYACSYHPTMKAHLKVL